MNKSWYKSLTIIAAVVIIGCLLMLIVDTPKPLSHDFTTIELCDWAEASSQNQFRLIVMQIAMAGCVLVIVGRIRAKGGIGKGREK